MHLSMKFQHPPAGKNAWNRHGHIVRAGVVTRLMSGARQAGRKKAGTPASAPKTMRSRLNWVASRAACHAVKLAGNRIDSAGMIGFVANAVCMASQTSLSPSPGNFSNNMPY